ncbi:MAG: hypothetical protein CM1200mP40_15860 [Gammaproteobacteria bacterium]|nr:MAG: hypothetical protein CM1200mP40_15860 [Gammaproteobacteria bacterium]
MSEHCQIVVESVWQKTHRVELFRYQSLTQNLRSQSIVVECLELGVYYFRLPDYTAA